MYSILLVISKVGDVALKKSVTPAKRMVLLSLNFQVTPKIL